MIGGKLKEKSELDGDNFYEKNQTELRAMVLNKVTKKGFTGKVAQRPSEMRENNVEIWWQERYKEREQR